MDVRSIMRAMGMLSASRSHDDWLQLIAKIPELAPYVATLRDIQGNRVAYSPDKSKRTESPENGEQAKPLPSPTKMLDDLVDSTKERWKQEDRERESKSPIAEAWKATRSQADDSDPAKAIVDKQLEAPPVQDVDGVSKASTAVDSAQMALDAVGFAGDAVVPGLGVAADGLNAGISAARVFTDPGRAKEHASNAAISLVGMIPFIGDAAKLLKTGRYAKTAQRVAKFADKSSEVTGKTTRAGYRGLASDALGSAAAAGGGGGDGVDGVSGSAPPMPPDDSNKAGSAIDRFADKIINATDAVMKFAGPLGKAYLWMKGIFKSAELAGHGVMAMNRDLSQYSGSMAAVYANYDIAQINRSREKGDTLAGPTSTLSEQLQKSQKLNDAITTPLSAMATDGISAVLFVANTIREWSPIYQTLGKALQYYIDIREKVFGAPDPNTPASKFFEMVARGELPGKKPEFANPPRPEKR